MLTRNADTRSARPVRVRYVELDRRYYPKPYQHQDGCGGNPYPTRCLRTNFRTRYAALGGQALTGSFLR